MCFWRYFSCFKKEQVNDDLLTEELIKKKNEKKSTRYIRYDGEYIRYYTSV